jgi:ferredoxin
LKPHPPLFPAIPHDRRRGAPGYEACSGCNLCLLVCPVWQQTRDMRLTPRGRAKALQHGATAGELADSIAQCTVCGACGPVCPEDIDLVGMILDLRRAVPLASVPAAPIYAADAPPRAAAPALLLPGAALRADPSRLRRSVALLRQRWKVAVADDDGADIALCIEAGAPLDEARVARFLRGLQGAKQFVLGEGMMHAVLKRLRAGLPARKRVTGLGEALNSLAAVRDRLRPGDFYVVEARAFHGDYARLIGHYDALRQSRGCAMNLDLQRIAMPTTAGAAQHALGLKGIDVAAQARWILEGREFDRIVVEDLRDLGAFAGVSDRPVLHLSDL